jgi:hypothetical protein
MSKRPPSIQAQISAAVEAAGGQTEVARRLKDAGVGIGQPQLSRLCNWQTPSLPTLRALAKVTGATFIIGSGTEVGESRPAVPSEERSKKST